MEEICRQPSPEESDSLPGLANAESQSDSSAENRGDMRVYSVGELLGNTLQSYRERGWNTEKDAEGEEEEEEFSSSGSVPRKRKKVAKGKKRQCRRKWTPDGEYTIVRTGPPLLYEDPDDCIADLTERSLTIFRHTDPTVVFGEDPERPLWKGVFRMAVGGYGKDEYYDPKRTHLKRIYSTDFPKKNRPPDNLQVRRDGVVELPYWVDEWYHAKNAEKGHKEKSKKKLQEKSRIEDMSVDAPTILAPVPSVVFPVTGWFKQNISKRGKAAEQTGGYPYSMALLSDAAKKTLKNMPAILAQLGPVGTVPVSLDKPEPPSSNQSSRPEPKKKEDKRGKKRVEKEKNPEEEEEEDDEEEEKQTQPQRKQHKKEERAVTFADAKKPPPSVQPKQQPPAPAKASTLNQKPQEQSDVVREAMQTFFNAASAGMATPGTFYYERLCQEGMTFDAFFGQGGPGDCVFPIAQIILKRLK